MDPAKTYVGELHEVLRQLPFAEINTAIDLMHETRMMGKKTFIMGNGGSASTASHFVCDLGKNTRVESFPSFRVIGLSDNMALLSAYANDDGYETVFARQLDGMVERGDLVIAISTSGNSSNVLQAVAYAADVGAVTVGLTGFDGGQLSEMVDLDIHIPSDTIEQVEDLHLMVEHLICKALRERAMADSRSAALREESAVREDQGKLLPALVEALVESVRSRPSLPELLQRTLDLAVEGIGAASGSILVLDTKGEIVDGAISYSGEVRQQPAQRLKEFLRSGLAGWVAKRGQAALIRDTRFDPRWLRSEWEIADDKSRSAVCVPLINNDRLVGVLTLVNTPPQSFTEADLALLMGIAVAVSVSGSDFFRFESDDRSRVESVLVENGEVTPINRGNLPSPPR